MKISTLLINTIAAILIFILMTPLINRLDLNISRVFFSDGHFQSNGFYDFVYHEALYPAWIAIVIACLIFLASLGFSSLKKWRITALYPILVLLLGSGFLIHAVLKDHWGRPRPKQITEFGGQQPFHPYYIPDFSEHPEPSKSFPCGHCSMGFFFFTVAFLGLHYKNRVVYYSGMLTAFVLGGTLGFVRIAQGGHFFSDVLVSALIMWSVSLGLYLVLFNDRKSP